MKKISTLLLLITGSVFAQEQTITLDSCIHLAKINYPYIKQNKLIEQAEDNNIKGINKNWLPRVSFTAQATYQSEVVNFSLPESNFPPFPKDQYSNALDIDQTVFDGGLTKQQKMIEKLSAQNELQKNETELYKLVDKVTQLYSTVLLDRAHLKTLTIYKDDINNKKKIVSESVKNGIVLSSNLEELEAEELKTEQSILEVKDNVDALYKVIGMYIKKSLDDSTKFQVTLAEGVGIKNAEIRRPELKVFAAQKELIEARHQLDTRAAYPRLSFFGEGVYGRPGYNILDQNLRLYGIAGIRLKWNIGTLYNLSTENTGANINKQLVDVQKEVFEFNLQQSLATQSAQIKTLKSVIEKDKTIMNKRHSITLAASSQLANGVITVTDYLTQLNAEMQAILNQQVNEIKLMNAISVYNATKGITNF